MQIKSTYYFLFAQCLFKETLRKHSCTIGANGEVYKLQ